MNVVKEFENKLLRRKEVELSFSQDTSTISRAEAKAQAVKVLKADEELVVVNSIKSKFGSRNATITVYVYEDAETLAKLTPEHVAKRNNPSTGAEE